MEKNMSHYFINDDNLNNEYRNFDYTFKSNRLSFTSDLGVFSKDRVDFGTNVLLNSLPDLKDVKSMLDVGCGVGVIGICVNKAYHDIKVMMVDVNDRCVSLANKNALSNHVNAKAINSNLYEKVEDKYDLILSNPPIRAGKKVVFGVVEEAKDHLNEGGKIIVVIQKKQGAASLEKRMEEVFKNVEVINKEKGYFIIQSVNRI